MPAITTYPKSHPVAQKCIRALCTSSVSLIGIQFLGRSKFSTDPYADTTEEQVASDQKADVLCKPNVVLWFVGCVVHETIFPDRKCRGLALFSSDSHNMSSS